jgi:hypothetical protein
MTLMNDKMNAAIRDFVETNSYPCHSLRSYAAVIHLITRDLFDSSRGIDEDSLMRRLNLSSWRFYITSEEIEELLDAGVGSLSKAAIYNRVRRMFGDLRPTLGNAPIPASA